MIFLHLIRMLYNLRRNCNVLISLQILVILLCHRGNKSHATANQLSAALKTILAQASFKSTNDLTHMEDYEPIKVEVRDVAGGLQAWSDLIDPEFPAY